MTKISNQYSLTNVLFADAVNGRVGIGTASPTVPLDVVGAGKFSSSLTTAGAIFSTNNTPFDTAGSITRHSVVGLALKAVTASVFDFSLYSAGGTALMTNPTGTNNINFNSGQVWFNGSNVGIGTSSPLNKFTVVGVSSFQLSEANDIRLIINPTASGINISSTYNTNGSYQPITISTSDTERMRIHPNGTKYFGAFNSSRLQINPSGEQVLSYTNNYYIWGIFNDSNSVAIESAFAGDIIFRAQAQSTSSSPTTAAERMRITSGGNVGIGTSSPNSKLQIGTMVAYTGSGYTFAMGNGTTDFLITVNAAQSGSSVTFYSSTDYLFNRSGPSSTGVISAYGFNNISDYRLKYDLESFDGLSLISQIKTYKYKMEETHETQYGVLAHEIQEVLPHLVVGVKDGDRMQSVDYQKIVPMLIKSIQEQQTQINELKALLNAH